MIARLIADRIAQRVARTAVVGALALGVAVPSVLPSPALAATTAPDLTVGLSPSSNPPPFTVGEFVSTLVQVANEGTAGAQDVRVHVVVGAGFGNVRLIANADEGAACGPLVAERISGPPKRYDPASAKATATAICTVRNLGPDQARFLTVEGTVVGRTNRTIAVTIDPKHQISESDETNNSASHTY